MEEEQVLQTVYGIESDHVPCNEMGITSAWIARGETTGFGATMESMRDKVM